MDISSEITNPDELPLMSSVQKIMLFQNSVHVEAISQNQPPTDSLGKCQVLGTEHEGDHPFCEGNTDPVPLVDQAKSMPPMGRHLLEGLPK